MTDNMEKITLRSMTLADLQEVASLHLAGFPDSRSTKLGNRFVRRLYRWYVQYQSQLSFVALQGEEIVGIISGTVDNDVPSRTLFTFWQIAGAVIRRPVLIFQERIFADWFSFLKDLLRIRRKATKSTEAQPPKLRATLDSIATLERVRRQRVGTKLIEAFEYGAQQAGATLIGLGVKFDNRQARNFYHSRGYRPIHLDAEQNSAYYEKDLNGD